MIDLDDTKNTANELLQRLLDPLSDAPETTSVVGIAIVLNINNGDGTENTTATGSYAGDLTEAQTNACISQMLEWAAHGLRHATSDLSGLQDPDDDPAAG